MPASPAPALSRRREVGEASARSLLMTVLGEYVLPRGQPVWTAALVRALGLLGVGEKSARQALARSAAEGWLSATRHGRRVRWELSGPGQTLLTDGAHRIYSFGRVEREWDGRWLLLLVSVPDAKRELRHRLRTRLAWAGFGALSVGVWVCPDAAREAEAREILTRLGLADAAMSFLGRYGSVSAPTADAPGSDARGSDARASDAGGSDAGGSDASGSDASGSDAPGSDAPGSVVAQAWDLDTVGRRYQAFIDFVAGLAPETGAELLVAQTRLVHAWRRFPFLDPQLPAELLPRPWAGTTAARLFHARHGQWQEGAQRHWDVLLAETE